MQKVQGKFTELTGGGMSLWEFNVMEKTVFTHQISPYFYTNGISPNQRAWFTAKDIPSNSPDVVRAHLEAVFW